MKARFSPASRRGFTITELLVSMALIVFIMYIIAEAFAAGSAAFRNLKAIGDMNERLRSALGTLRRYLQADHFEGKKRLSDPDFWKDGPPQEGFFRVWHGDNNNYEGQDLDLNSCFRTTSHGLHFTARLRGFKRSDLFSTQVPGTSPLLSLPDPASRYQDAGSTTFASPWAEVAVFMQPTGEFTKDAGGNDGLPMYSLLLRPRLLVTDNDDVTAAAPAGGVAVADAANYLEMSTSVSADPTKLYFNNPGDVTLPGRRFGSNADPAGNVPPSSYRLLGQDNASLSGADTLIGNVVSFDVRVLTTASNDFVSLYDPTVTQYDREYTADVASPKTRRDNPQFITTGYNATTAPRVFDTWSSRRDQSFDLSGWASTPMTATHTPLYQNAAGNRIRIRALQITLRVWDDRTKQTRQSSIVVDM